METAAVSTYTQICYHIVFGTHERRPWLQEEGRERFFRYGWGIVNGMGSKLYRINCVQDHVHLLTGVHPDVSLSEFVKAFKIGTTPWIKRNGVFPGFDRWQVGYAAITHSMSERIQLIEYVKGQEEHHRKETFKDEFRRLLEEAGIAFDERYLI